MIFSRLYNPLIILSTLVTFFIGHAFAQEELTYEEYLLPVTVNWNEREPLKAMCEFAMQYDNSIYARRKSWRQYRDDDWNVEKYNEKLKIIDFSLVPNTECWHSPSYDLMKGDSIFAGKLEFSLFSSSFFFNDTTNQFIILTSIRNPNGPPYRKDILITNNFVKIEPFPHINYVRQLCFYQNGILFLHDGYREQSVLFMDIHNENEAVLLLKYEIKSEYPDFIHKNLTVKNSDWIFECEENVFVNGINIGKEKGYSKTFDYSYIDDKPFYFYEKDSLIHISSEYNFIIG